MTAISDFEDALKKYNACSCRLRAAAQIAATELMQRIPALATAPGRSSITKMFLDTVAA